MFQCRSCGSSDSELILHKEEAPIANDFTYNPVKRGYSLTLVMCSKCSLVQILEEVSPVSLFKDYRYLSSTSRTLSKHFEDYADYLVEKFPNKNYVFIDIGANDGVLLGPLVNKHRKVALGVDPAENIQECENTVVLREFFTDELAKNIKAGYLKDSIFVVNASNMFAHIPNLGEILTGVQTLIGNTGYFFVEVNYALDITNKNMFDSVYHEHLYYYTVGSLKSLFRSFDMEIVDVQWLPMHGGSIRVAATRLENLANDKFGKRERDNVEKFEAIERYTGVNTPQAWRQSYNRYQAMISRLASKLSDIDYICAYGAAARACMLIDDLYCEDTDVFIDFIVDESKEKIGRLTPVTGIEVVPPKTLYDRYTDACLLSAWTYENEIKQKERFYKGQWIVPFKEGT